jgi:hypothetical protein
VPRLEYFLVAEDVSIDQATNRISLFNVLDAIRSPFPLLIWKCCAVALWQQEPGDEGRDFQSVVRVTAPNGQIHQLETNFRLSRPRHRIINRLQGVPIHAAGELRFELLLNGQHAAFHVVQIEAPPPAEETPPLTH